MWEDLVVGEQPAKLEFANFWSLNLFLQWGTWLLIWWHFAVSTFLCYQEEAFAPPPPCEIFWMKPWYLPFSILNLLSSAKFNSRQDFWLYRILGLWLWLFKTSQVEQTTLYQVLIVWLINCLFGNLEEIGFQNLCWTSSKLYK